VCVIDGPYSSRKKAIRAPCEGKPHARCDEWRLETGLGYGLRHRHMAKAAGKQLLPNTYDYRANRRLYLTRLPPCFEAGCSPWPMSIHKACARLGIFSVAGCSLLVNMQSFRRISRTPTLKDCLPYFEKRIDRRSNRTAIGTRFTDPVVRTSVEVDGALIRVRPQLDNTHYLSVGLNANRFKLSRSVRCCLPHRILDFCYLVGSLHQRSHRIFIGL